MAFSVTKQRKLWWTVSGLAFIGSLVLMGVSILQLNAPLRPGLDFVGGTRLQLARDCVIENCAEPLDLDQVREILTEQGYANSALQIIGGDGQTLSVRTPNLNVDQRETLQTALSEAVGPFDSAQTQIDSVGPTIGRELFVAGILALLASFFGIVAYLSFRFKFDYALFAILALLHDATIVAGFFALLGLVVGVEVDSLFLVALLTIVGFSVNDTVVIYDRIRETLESADGSESTSEIVDRAVNQTLTRSINTTLTTVLPLIGIFLFGGDTLKFFALALILGFLLGAYSSIFLASTLLSAWRDRTGKNPEPATTLEATSTDAT
ncbi:MAG: protein translocase subunit SecF [Cyanobacteria bacterium P01_H01_bin.15]